MAELDLPIGEVALERLDPLEQLGAEELDLPAQEAGHALELGARARALLGEVQEHAPVQDQRRIDALLLRAHLAPLLEALVQLATLVVELGFLRARRQLGHARKRAEPLAALDRGDELVADAPQHARRDM